MNSHAVLYTTVISEPLQFGVNVSDTWPLPVTPYCLVNTNLYKKNYNQVYAKKSYALLFMYSNKKFVFRNLKFF